MPKITVLEQFLEIDGSRLPLYSIDLHMPTIHINEVNVSVKVFPPAGVSLHDYSMVLSSLMKYPSSLLNVWYYYRNKNTQEETQIKFNNPQIKSWAAYTYAGSGDRIEITFTATSIKTIDFTKAIDLID